MLILFQPVCSSSSGSNLVNIRNIYYQFFSMVFVSSVQSCLCFPTHPLLFFFKDSDILIKYPSYWCEVSSFFSFNVLIQWFPMKMLNSFKFIILHCCFFSGGFNSSFRCWSYPFPRFKCFPMSVHLLIVHLSLFLSGVLKISQKNHVPILNSFELLLGFSLIQAI